MQYEYELIVMINPTKYAENAPDRVRLFFLNPHMQTYNGMEIANSQRIGEIVPATK